MVDSSDPNNGRVTLAEIKKDIAYLSLQVQGFHHDACKRLEDLEKEKDKTTVDVARLQERQGWMTGVQAISVAVGAALGRIGQS